MDEQIPPVPPVQSVQLAETPSKWPTVFGVIGIILAALGVLGSCCGAISPLVWPRYIQWLEGMEGVTEEQIAMAKAGMLPAAWMVPASLVGLVMSVILMIGAIRLLRRLSSGVGLCKFWAWFTLLQARVPKGDQPMGAVGQYLGLAVGGCWVLVIGVGLPLFALYWFMREPVRAEIVLWDEERRGVI
ncbi:MAG: hypothetical protein ACYTA3_14425 [Planctomycetota bacterium]|jgi:hypothetical protein